jgi:hypothetical protein
VLTPQPASTSLLGPQGSVWILSSCSTAPSTCSCTYTWKVFLFCFFVEVGFELRAYALSQSTVPVFVKGFGEIGSRKLFVWAGFDPPDLCLLSSWDYRCEPRAPAWKFSYFLKRLISGRIRLAKWRADLLFLWRSLSLSNGP